MLQREKELANIVLEQGDHETETLTLGDEVDCLQPCLSWDYYYVILIIHY